MLVLNIARVQADKERSTAREWRGRKLKAHLVTDETTGVGEHVAAHSDPRTLMAEVRYPDVRDALRLPTTAQVARAMRNMEQLGWLEKHTTGRSVIVRWNADAVNLAVKNPAYPQGPRIAVM